MKWSVHNYNNILTLNLMPKSDYEYGVLSKATDEALTAWRESAFSSRFVFEWAYSMVIPWNG